MNLKKFVLFLLFLLFVIPVSHAATCVYFFHGDGCPHCANVIPFIDSVKEMKIHDFEVYNNMTNALLLNEFFESYNIPANQRGVPTVFVANTYLIGDKPIIENLESYKNLDAECPVTENIDAEGISGDSSPEKNVKSITIATVIGAALVDSINPCAIAVLLILLSALMTSGNAGKAIRTGLAFIASIYIVYFLFGLGILALFKEFFTVLAGGSGLIQLAVGILAIIIGIANIKDFISYGSGGFVMEIPRRWRPRMKSILSKAMTPLGAFSIGFLVSLFELPCTGGPYFFILGHLADKVTYASVIPILLLYNLVFILPLIAISLLLYFGKMKTENADEWKDRNLRKLHLATGFIMILLGLMVILL